MEGCLDAKHKGQTLCDGGADTPSQMSPWLVPCFSGEDIDGSPKTARRGLQSNQSEKLRLEGPYFLCANWIRAGCASADLAMTCHAASRMCVD